MNSGTGWHGLAGASATVQGYENSRSKREASHLNDQGPMLYSFGYVVKIEGFACIEEQYIWPPAVEFQLLFGLQTMGSRFCHKIDARESGSP
jgi:hypothetical protein